MTRRSVNGVVTFAQLAVGSPGSYRLIASGKRIPAEHLRQLQRQQTPSCAGKTPAVAHRRRRPGRSGGQDVVLLRIDVTAPANPAGRAAERSRPPSTPSPPLDCPGYADGPDTAVFVVLNREKIVRYTALRIALAADPRTLQASASCRTLLVASLTPSASAQDTNGDGAADQFVGQLTAASSTSSASHHAACLSHAESTPTATRSSDPVPANDQDPPTAADPPTRAPRRRFSDRVGGSAARVQSRDDLVALAAQPRADAADPLTDAEHGIRLSAISKASPTRALREGRVERRRGLVELARLLEREPVDALQQCAEPPAAERSSTELLAGRQRLLRQPRKARFSTSNACTWSTPGSGAATGKRTRARRAPRPLLSAPGAAGQPPQQRRRERDAVVVAVWRARSRARGASADRRREPSLVGA